MPILVDEAISMNTITFDVPAMYADHHVMEVRRILFELPGVKNVVASSAFLAVEITFEPDKIDEAALREALAASGYLQEIPATVETGVAADNRAFPRHSTAIRQVGTAVSFAQTIPSAGMPTLSCPGLGPIRMED
jgi:copper chaperone CopZ